MPSCLFADGNSDVDSAMNRGSKVPRVLFANGKLKSVVESAFLTLNSLHSHFRKFSKAQLNSFSGSFTLKTALLASSLQM